MSQATARGCKQQPVSSDTRTKLVILASKFPSDGQMLLQLYIELMCFPPIKKKNCYTEIFLFKKAIPHCAAIVRVYVSVLTFPLPLVLYYFSICFLVFCYYFLTHDILS